MRSWVLFVLIGLVLAAGCQQREGPAPERDSQVANRLNDIKRDIENIAGGDRGAPTDLMDDLAVFTESEPGEEAARELGRRVAALVSAKALTEETTVKLVEQLWIVTAAHDFNQRQHDSVRDEVQALLKSAGVDASAVESVVEQVAEVQDAVSRRSRRWYERY